MFRTAILLATLLISSPVAATEAGWALLRDGGHVVLMRHAYALGSVEPPSFDIEKCNTQRGLSERGRVQARKIGALFAARAAPVDRVLSSRLCRALDTARIAFGARYVEEFAPLDPLPTEENAAAAAREAALAAVRDYGGYDNLVLVTDLANIQSLTGASAREGEALIVTPADNGLHVLARIVFN